jgi:hypothetical protein
MKELHELAAKAHRKAAQMQNECARHPTYKNAEVATRSTGKATSATGRTISKEAQTWSDKAGEAAWEANMDGPLGYTGHRRAARYHTKAALVHEAIK